MCDCDICSVRLSAANPNVLLIRKLVVSAGLVLMNHVNSVPDCNHFPYLIHFPLKSLFFFGCNQWNCCSVWPQFSIVLFEPDLFRYCNQLATIRRIYMADNRSLKAKIGPQTRQYWSWSSYTLLAIEVSRWNWLNNNINHIFESGPFISGFVLKYQQISNRFLTWIFFTDQKISNWLNQVQSKGFFCNYNYRKFYILNLVYLFASRDFQSIELIEV